MGLDPLTLAIGGGSLLGAGSAIYGADQNRKAIHSAADQQKELIAGLKYEPIDIEQLKADTTAQAIQNATGSLALERQISPSTAGIRSSLPGIIQKELSLGGRLSPDVANQVASQSRVIGAGSGNFGNVAPITAALTGQTAQGLMNQRQQESMNWLAANPLQPTGIDPGTLASLEAQNNAAQNQFNLAKAGVNSNLINSQLQGNLASTAGTVSAINQLGGLLPMFGAMGSRSASSSPGTTGLGSNVNMSYAFPPTFSGSLYDPSQLKLSSPTRFTQ